MPSRTLHMGVDKLYLMQRLKEGAWGLRETLPNFTGTLDEALEEIEADPREVFTGCDCKKNDDGSCSGEVG